MRKSENKELLKKGIIRLLSKKKSIDITVVDLIRESGVPRASFYRIYKNVDEVIDDVVEDINNDYRNIVLPAIRARDERAIKKLLHDYYTSVKDVNNPYTHMIPDNFSLIISKMDQNNREPSEISSSKLINKYVPELLIMGISILAVMWRKKGFIESVDEMTEFTFNMICKKLIF